MSRVEESQVESLEVRQAKLQAVADYKKELEVRELDELGADLGIELQDVMDEISLYSAFANQLTGINGALVEEDIAIVPYHRYKYGFEDVKEVQELADRAERFRNRTNGHPLYGRVGEEISKMVNQNTPSLVAELVQLSEGAESMTF